MINLTARLASGALLTTVMATTSASAVSGRTAASAQDRLQGPTVGQTFGCSFNASLAEDFSNHIVPKGSMRCSSLRLADLRLTLLRNGVPAPRALVVNNVKVPTQTDAFAATGVRCSPAWYRSQLIVRLFHNGTSTVLRTKSRSVYLRPSPSHSSLPACYESAPKR